VFLDETGTTPTWRAATALRTTTFVAGLRQGGIVAPLVLDGPLTGPASHAYVEQCLAPAL
jgi:hypothetical protein